MEDFQTLVEISSCKVKLLAGYNLKGAAYPLFVGEKNITRSTTGLIANEDECINALKQLVKEANLALNASIKEVSVILPAFKLDCSETLETVNTTDDHKIDHTFINFAIANLSKKQYYADDMKIVSVVPNAYILDNNERFEDEPIGKISGSLTIYASLYGMSETVSALHHDVIERCSLHVINNIVAPLANAYSLQQDSLPKDYILVDFGDSITTISEVKNASEVVQSEIFKYGGHDITSAIQERFNLEESEAENLKVKYGIDENPSFELDLGGGATFSELAKTIITSLKTLTQDIKETIDHHNLVGRDIILTGGSSNLYHLESFIEDELKLKVYDYDNHTLGCRERGYGALVGGLNFIKKNNKFIKQDLDEGSITRVDTKKIIKNRLEEDL